MKRIYVVTLPAVPGAPLHHPSSRSAERELRNAIKAGLGEGGYVRSLLIPV